MSIGANATGEWLTDPIDVPLAGAYGLDVRLATPKNGRQVHLEFGGIDRTGSMDVPASGWWTSWQVVNPRVDLDAGRQTMRLVIDDGGVTIGWMALTCHSVMGWIVDR